MSMKSMLDKRSGQSLLHGSDVPDGIKAFTIEVAAMEPSPEWIRRPRHHQICETHLRKIGMGREQDQHENAHQAVWRR